MRRRAVITGVGAVTPFGAGVGTLHAALAEGRSAVRPIESFDARTFPVRVAGEVPARTTSAAWLSHELGKRDSLATAVDARAEHWERAGLLRDRKIAFLLIAAVEAWRDAGCGEAERSAPSCLALGLEQALLEDLVPVLRDGVIDWSASANALPEVRYRTNVDLGARLLHEVLELSGPRFVHVSACAASAIALGHAAALIARGEADVVLCGGADSMVNPLGIGGMARLGAPSPRAAPDACRPFDAARDGLVVGEGSAVFVLEEEGRARARGARPRARLTGWGGTQDAYKATAPRPDGSAAARAMRRAVERAGLTPERVGYINAHGTGTPLNDPAEARAIHLAFGPAGSKIPVSSQKGALGHLMAACGAVELAAALLCFERDLLPGTAHLANPDPACDLELIGPTPRSACIDVLLSSSFGFGGQNGCIVMERCA